MSNKGRIRLALIMLAIIFIISIYGYLENMDEETPILERKQEIEERQIDFL